MQCMVDSYNINKYNNNMEITFKTK